MRHGVVVMRSQLEMKSEVNPAQRSEDSGMCGRQDQRRCLSLRHPSWHSDLRSPRGIGRQMCKASVHLYPSAQPSSLLPVSSHQTLAFLPAQLEAHSAVFFLISSTRHSTASHQ
jgi:hypothetical protein